MKKTVFVLLMLIVVASASASASYAESQYVISQYSIKDPVLAGGSIRVVTPIAAGKNPDTIVSDDVLLDNNLFSWIDSKVVQGKE